MKRIVLWLASFAALFTWAEADHVVLDYVEATGTQWVDTGVVGRYDTKAEIEAEWTSLEGDMALLACRGNDGTEENATRINFANGFNYGQGLLVGYGYGLYVRPRVQWIENEGKENEQSFRSERAWELDRIYAISTEFAKTGASETTIRMTVDGVKMMEDQVNKTDCAVTNALVNTGCNLAIFANNLSGQIVGGAKARIYGLKIWQDGVLKRDFVPVLKDGRAGFRDAVTGGFFYSNSGTELVAGPDASTPDGYVGYIESTGNEFVDLDVVGRSGLTLESRMSWTEVPGDGSYVASRLGQNVRFYMYHHYQKNTIGYNGYYNTGAVAQPGVVYDIRSVLNREEQRLTVNGVDQISRADRVTVDTGLNLYLFACNKDGEAVYKTKARCYGLKIWDGETLVRDLVPCVKRRKAALLDRVSGRFFFAGDGTLAMGRETTPGRPDYFVEYLESKGDTWLDTGVRARPDIRATGEFALTLAKRSVQQERYLYFGDAYGHAERTVLGACDNWGSRRFYPVHMPNGELWMGYNETRLYPPKPGTVDTRCALGTARHSFDVTLAQGNQKVVLDGETVHQGADASSFDTGVNLYLFACNKGGSPAYLSNARVYGLKLWQDGELKRDFRPCVKDGVAGFHDAVNDEIVYPAVPIRKDCIGDAIYADDMKPVQLLEYVESDGSQWFDTGVVGRSGTVAEFKMAWLYLRDDPDVGFLGSRRDGGDTRFYMWHDAHNTQSFGYLQFTYFNGNDATSPNWRDDPNHLPVELGRPYEVTSSFLADRQTIVVDGATRLDIARTGGLDTGCTMYLFAYNNYGTAACQSAARLYGLKLWQDGVRVRDFVPVRLDCGLNALWDRVEGKIYAPLSGSIRKWGPVIGDYVTPPKGTVLLFR